MPNGSSVPTRRRSQQIPRSSPFVVEAELRSMALQRQWQRDKQTKLDELLRRIPKVDINHPSVIARFAEIDAYRLGKLSTRPLPAGISSRAIGDNDLWIAAVSSVLNAVLITTDRDFDVLDGVFLTRLYVDPKSTP